VNKELELWQFIANRLETADRVMLLVVATSSGSSPGRPSYKMAVAENGELIGSIGGGVMEVNLVEQSRAIFSEPPAVAGGLAQPIREQIHRKNAPNSSGMICSGKQTVLFKLLTANNIETVNAATVGVKTRGGSVLHITPDTINVESAKAGNQDLDIAFERNSDTDFEYRERLGAKNELLIIGGGHCSLALSEMMTKMDFHVSLIDDRPQLNTIEKNKFADEIAVVDSYENIGGRVEPNEHAYVVVMTLGYKTDSVVIRQLINKDFKYFGVLGSKAKMTTLFRELLDEGYSTERLDKIRTPIGLPINSHSPEEIAVSIAAEIIAVKNGARL
jgi:xanthine dehydrogenase accessory factor